MSYTYDFRRWTYFGRTNAGENVSLLTTDSGYIMFHSPQNGIAMKRSADMREWQDFGSLITLGQDKWDWARGRLTAGTVLDLRHVRRIGHYVMFFHGSGPLPKARETSTAMPRSVLPGATTLYTGNTRGRIVHS